MVRFLGSLFLWPVSASALSVAFIAPPASHYVPMLPIAHQLLEDGHKVTFVGLPETMKKIGKLVPKAQTRKLDAEEPSKGALKFVQKMPYALAQFFTNFAIPMMGNLVATFMLFPAKKELEELKPDVLCLSFAYPPFYALAEVLGVPVVGIGWASPGFLTLQNDMPWSLEPNFGSILSRKDIHENLSHMLLNLGVRLFGFFTMRLGSLVLTYLRFQLGHPRPLELWEFDCVLQNPVVGMTLPELTAGSPNLLGPYTFMVGILDHPGYGGLGAAHPSHFIQSNCTSWMTARAVGLGGNSIAKSDDASRIMTWLDDRAAAKEKVLYAAFGSEIMIDEPVMRFLVGAFKDAPFRVLWSTKVEPTIPVPDSVLVTKFAPQRAVLSHSAVFGFLSHGGANSVNEALMLGKPLVIVPFFADQMANAVQQQELGVALLVRKDAESAVLASALRRVAEEPSFAKRSAQVKELNDQRKDMSRAVQVIVNQGSGAFRMNIPPPPSMWVRSLPVLLSVGFFSLLCNACCCLRIRLQQPCSCCCRGSRAPAGKAKEA